MNWHTLAFCLYPFTTFAMYRGVATKTPSLSLRFTSAPSRQTSSNQKNPIHLLQAANKQLIEAKIKHRESQEFYEDYCKEYDHTLKKSMALCHTKLCLVNGCQSTFWMDEDCLFQNVKGEHRHKARTHQMVEFWNTEIGVVAAEIKKLEKEIQLQSKPKNDPY